MGWAWGWENEWNGTDTGRVVEKGINYLIVIVIVIVAIVIKV
jgi:hypothetical protein